MTDDVADLIDRDATCDALLVGTQRLAELLARVADPTAPAIGVWTLGDVANHVAWGIENYTLWLEGEDASDLDAIENMPQWNIDSVRDLPDPDPPRLAERIYAATERFIRAAKAEAPSARVRWYAGNVIPVQVAVCMRLVEAIIHGLDIARAANDKWAIDIDHARTMSYGLAYISPHFVDRSKLDFAGTIEIRVRGGASLYYVVQEASLMVRTSAPAAGWHLSVDPVAWVLVTTERQNQWRAAAGGKLIGWGRRPSLPFKLRAAAFQG